MPQMTREMTQLKRRIQLLLAFFVFALVVSGITAIPLTWESSLLNRFLGKGSLLDNILPPFAAWVSFVDAGLQNANREYPFLYYGTDWLAFAHIVIAIAFLGPLRDPIKNLWVVEFGMIACILIIPTALVFGAVRGIPFFWQILDCAFGVFGIIPLYLVRKDIQNLQAITAIRSAQA